MNFLLQTTLPIMHDVEKKKYEKHINKESCDIE